MKKLIIIPAYNEAQNIVALVQTIQDDFPEYDYIVVNDDSTDATGEVMEKYGNCINLSDNLGIGGAVQTGYIYAWNNNYDIAVQMDGDGQHDPKYLDDLVAPIEKGEADVCIGSRFLTGEGFQSSWPRRVGIRFLSNLVHLLTGVRVTDITSGFRAVDRTMIELFAKDYPQDYPEPEALMMSAYTGAVIKEIPVIMRERWGAEAQLI